MRIKLLRLTATISLCTAFTRAAEQQSVFDKDLVTPAVSHPSQILEHHETVLNVTGRSFDRTVLGYVTPWNSKGYEIAKWFKGRFTHVSPVWYSLRPGPDGNIRLQGGHDVDQGWMSQIRRTKEDVHGAYIVPRFQFLDWEERHYLAVLQDSMEAQKIHDLLLKEIRAQAYDGLVLEMGIPLRYLSGFIKGLSKKLKATESNDESPKFIYVVIPPKHTYMAPESVPSHADLKDLIDDVDGFSLMTYDYTASLKPGPNAPIQWMQENVQRLDPSSLFRDKLLLGLNLYGYEYSTKSREAFIGHRYLEILKGTSPKFEYKAEEVEHAVHFTDSKSGDNRVAYYPTLYSLNERIALAQELGTALGLWDIGQGLTYFYELF